ncbi:MAG TPA: alanine racemase [Thermoanaerobaculia bacterium]|nr:alanine racemase [Thermoanaerobaculia bacterium]
MFTAPDFRPTWAEVDLAAFSRNVDAVIARLPRRSRLIAVLKADAYGHGAVELAKRSADRVAMVAVALLEEAIELRNAGVDLPVLVFGPVKEEFIPIALDRQITLGVVGPEELAEICRVARNRDVAIHLKLDTGMGRMGVTESELPHVVEMVRSTPRLRIDAVYTHFANADDADDPLTDEQVAKFAEMTKVLNAPLHHLANSAATMRGIVSAGDYVRVGIALLTGEFEPVLRWRTEIVRLKSLPAGHGIGYGTTFHTKRPSRIATLPVGYADGYDRLLSNNADVLVRGKRAPVVGRVSMDLVTIDVTDIAGVQYGDEVILLGGEITAEELAERTGTIPYEVFCRISKRVPRVYR